MGLLEFISLRIPGHACVYVCLQSEVKRVEPQAGGVSVERAGQVVLADGSAVDYDFLIVALGAETDTRGVPGVRDHAVPFNTYDDAIRVCGQLALLCEALLDVAPFL